MTFDLRRLDTLFLRLFVLMWAGLVASHFIAYTTVTMVLGHGTPPTWRAGRSEPAEPGAPAHPAVAAAGQSVQERRRTCRRRPASARPGRPGLRCRPGCAGPTTRSAPR